MRVPWLADVLRSADCRVRVYGNPWGLGKELGSVKGVVWHDTVTTTEWTDDRVAHLLHYGRSDLPGPLAQLGLDREGVFWFIADGRANHNGFGEWGNNSIGIEAFCAGGLVGREEPWNERQRDSAVRGTKAILDYLKLPYTQAKGHKETDPRRKIDPWGTDCDELRAWIVEKGWFEMATRDDLRAELEGTVPRLVREELLRMQRETDAEGKEGQQRVFWRDLKSLRITVRAVAEHLGLKSEA